MTTPESKVKDKIKKILKAKGIYYAMPHGAGYGNAGVPDFLCCVRGYFLAIEAKAKGGKPTALQVRNMDDIRKAGGVSLVVDEPEPPIRKVIAEGTPAEVQAHPAVIEAYLDLAWRGRSLTPQVGHYMLTLAGLVWATGIFAGYAVLDEIVGEKIKRPR